MSEETLPYLVDKLPVDICQTLEMGDSARALLNDELTSRQFLKLLSDKEEYVDGVRFWAHALQKREAIWWACQCAKASMGQGAPLPEHAALDAAEQWCANPTEERRRAAEQAYEAAGLGTPAGCAAAAAFWYEGSLAPPNVPVVPPAEDLSAHGVAGSVMLAAVRSEPEKAPEKYRHYFELGVEVAKGVQRWSAPAKRSVDPERTPDQASTGAPKRPVINWD